MTTLDSSLVHGMPRKEVARLEAMGFAHDLFLEALEVIRANGDLYSANLAKKALEKASKEFRRRNM